MKELYKGFIRSEGKNPKEKYKGINSFKSYEEVKDYKCFMGIMREDIILIDIDNPEQSEILLNIIDDFQVKCRVYQTTRGKHFLFKNSNIDKCYNHCNLACGLIADIKTGGLPEAIKVDGVEREIVYDKFDDEEYDELPYWLKPLKTKKDFIGLENGDGRNPDLFGYILVLQSNSFSKEQIKEIITMINKYVFKEPLGKKELETILRDESFEKPNFYDNGKLDVNGFAKFLIANEHICKMGVGTEDILYIYKNGVYVSNMTEIESKMIEYIPNLLFAKRSEVIKMIKLLLKERSKPAKENYIAFKNGIYDIENNKLLNFTPEIIITNQIPWNYNSSANDKRARMILKNWVNNNEDTCLLLEECIGMCMYRSNKIGACFMLTGDKDNGKSTFFEMLNLLLGDENCSHVELHKLETKFENVDIFGKLANLGDDIGDEYISKTETFKKLVTGQVVRMQNKGEKAFDFKYTGKLIFSANSMPRISDPTGAVVEKRIIFIPFKANFNVKNKDLDFVNNFENNEIMETLIQLGIAGIKRVLKNKQFSESEETTTYKKQYQYDNDVASRFIDEYGVDNIHFENTNKVLSEYKIFCDREESLSKSPQILNRGIKKILGYDKIKLCYKKDGKVKTVYYYAKQDEVLTDDIKEKLKK